MPHSAEEGLKCTAAYLAPKTLTVESQVLQKHCQGHTFIKVLLCVNENAGATQRKVFRFSPSVPPSGLTVLMKGGTEI